MEQCIYCETVYELEDSTSNIKDCCCSIECENKYRDLMHKLLEFID